MAWTCFIKVTLPQPVTVASDSGQWQQVIHVRALDRWDMVEQVQNLSIAVPHHMRFRWITVEREGTKKGN